MKLDIRTRIQLLRMRNGLSRAVGSEVANRPRSDYYYWRDVFALREAERKLVEIERRANAYWIKRNGREKAS